VRARGSFPRSSDARSARLYGLNSVRERASLEQSSRQQREKLQAMVDECYNGSVDCSTRQVELAGGRCAFPMFSYVASSRAHELELELGPQERYRMGQ
jgi:hypothetical protein